MDPDPKERLRKKLLELRHNRTKHRNQKDVTETTDKTETSDKQETIDKTDISDKQSTCARCGWINVLKKSPKTEDLSLISTRSEFFVCQKCGDFNNPMSINIKIDQEADLLSILDLLQSNKI